MATPILKFLVNPNLKGEAAAVSAQYQAFAADLDKFVEDLDHKGHLDAEARDEVTVGFRKLLEAKDCFVRAAVSHRVPE